MPFIPLFSTTPILFLPVHNSNLINVEEEGKLLKESKQIFFL